jgi:excisionase family DNA binding protein
MTQPPGIINPSERHPGRRLARLNIPDAEIDRILGECIAALNGQIAPPDGLLLTPSQITRVTARQATAVLEGRKSRRPTLTSATRQANKAGIEVARCSIKQAATILGLPSRTIQDLAARGKIAGAAKLGRRWTFDQEKLRRFIREKERETWHNASRPLDVSGVAKPFGAGLRFAGENSDGRFTRVTRRLRARNTRPRGSG